MPPSPRDIAAGLTACGRIAREHDRDRFVISLFAPADRRASIWALLAFNHEVARTREAVSEPMLGQIRLQWWREALDGAYAGTPRRHEVVEPLAAAIAAHALDRAAFDRLLEAREADFDPDQAGFADCAALLAYAQATGGGLQRLIAQALGAHDEASQEAAAAVGTAWALIGLLRALPFLARRNRWALPDDLLAQAGLSRADLARRQPPDAVAEPVVAVCALARERLAAARARRCQIAPAARPALLLAALADSHLARLRKSGHRPFDPRVQAGPPLRHLPLTVKALIGRW